MTTAQTKFTANLVAATTQHAAYDALYQLSNALVPVRLWTVMSVDHDADLARRAFSNMSEAYPASGTKPMVHNAWSDIVRGQHKCFVANTLAEIADVFPDHPLIGSLGCGSVLNLPIVHGGQLIGTVNLLDAEHHFTPERVQTCENVLTDPAREAMLRALGLPDA
jgi:GAF domain-containing protein